MINMHRSETKLMTGRMTIARIPLCWILTTQKNHSQEQSMVHDLSPFLIRFYDNFGIRWYGLSYLMGFFVAYILIRWLTQRQRTEINAEMASDFITYLAIGTLVGGRLGYCLFYSPDLFTKFKDSFPYWGVFAVNEGGMASHGGIIGVMVACLLFARRYNLNYLYLFDLVCVSGPLGIFFGRIANFINGELVGRPASPDWPLAVKFPQDILQSPQAADHPGIPRLTELTDVVEKLSIPRDQWFSWIGSFQKDPQSRDQVYQVLNRIIEEIQKGNLAVKQAIEPILTPRHPSQLYAAFGEGLLIFLVLFWLARKSRKPGFIASTFVVMYSIVRIADEQFRMPDAHIGFQWLGLTRGQWLSIVMITCGIILMFWWGRSTSKTVHGWGRLQSIKLNRK